MNVLNINAGYVRILRIKGEIFFRLTAKSRWGIYKRKLVDQSITCTRSIDFSRVKLLCLFLEIGVYMFRVSVTLSFIAKEIFPLELFKAPKVSVFLEYSQEFA